MENNKIKEILEKINISENEILNNSNNFNALLTLPDEQFNLLAPAVLLELEKNLNSNQKYILLESLKDNEIELDKLIEGFEKIIEGIDKTPNFSIPKKNFLRRAFGIISNSLSSIEGVSKKTIQIPIELCHENAKIPTYAHATDAGADVYAIEDFTLAPGESKIIPTGLKVAIPLGYELQVRARSGISAKTKLILANGIGTIDSSYRGEIGIILENIEPRIKDIGYTFDETGKPIILAIEHGQSYTFSKGDRIAQLVLNEVPKAAFYQVDNVEEIGDNRGGGFGSTDKK